MHSYITGLVDKIETKGEAANYLLLLGTSARLIDIKTYYINSKIHCKILEYIKHHDWMREAKFVANLSYALSSLCYTQNHIAIDIVRNKPAMLALL